MDRRLIVVACSCVVAAAAHAGFSPIGAGSPGEPSLASALNSAYGAGAVNIEGTFTLGDYTFERLHDTGAAGLVDLQNPFGFAGAAETFADGVTDFEARVRFAANTNTLAWKDTASGVEQDILTFTGPNNQVNPGLTTTASLSTDFSFVLKGPDTGPAGYSSIAANNGAAGDRLVVFALSRNTDGRQGLLLAWEDRDVNAAGEDDFQDFVVELLAIPSPSAVLLGLVGLSGLAGVARRFR